MEQDYNEEDNGIYAKDDTELGNIYSQETRENLVEDDMLSVQEEAFMKGYENDFRADE